MLEGKMEDSGINNFTTGVEEDDNKKQ